MQLREVKNAQQQQRGGEGRGVDRGAEEDEASTGVDGSASRIGTDALSTGICSMLSKSSYSPSVTRTVFISSIGSYSMLLALKGLAGM